MDGELSERAILEFGEFRPRLPWIGPDLQTIRNFVARPKVNLHAWPAQRLWFDAGGDRLSGVWHRTGRTDRPLVILLHGLTGCERSSYVLLTAFQLLRRGYPVLRLNLRGAGPSRPHCREGYHAGRSEDLHTVLAGLPAGAARAGFALVGYSLGANILLKFLAEPQVAAHPVRAAVSISAPIDLALTQRRILERRNRVYHAFLLNRMRKEALLLLRDRKWRRRILLADTVREFDERVTAPLYGFESVDDYHARCSAAPMLHRIGVPTLLIHGLDDPWIPADPYLAFDWRAHPQLTALLPPQGGHVGFHGRGDRLPWHDRCIATFFDRHLV
ncbi:MAG TPA: alpha/beta fold hydrolase [Alphaproteobacteria bacterium]|nr:alpha/beta fold hydrolase [Alphaproteobacteria bacterium]